MQVPDPINQIKSTLREYEEPYHLGAWDKFKRHRMAKRREYLYKRLAVACALLLTLFSAWYSGIMNRTDQVVTESHSVVPELPSPEITPVLPDLGDDRELPGGDVTDVFLKSDLAAAAEPRPHDDDGDVHSKFQPSLPQYVIDLGAAGYVSGLERITDATAMPLSRPAYGDSFDMLSTHYGGDEATGNRTVGRHDLTAGGKERDLTFGFAYSSLLNMSSASTDWNVGGGFTVNYGLNSQLTLSSGIYLAQSRLRYHDASETELMATKDNITSSVMEINFLSLEVPLNLQVAVTDRIYFSGGVSSASFLRERYHFSYEYQELVTTTILIEGEHKPVVQLQTFSSSEQESEPSLSSFHPVAFYNLSAGYNLTGSGNSRYTVTVEPFVKLPAGSFASKNVSYSTGGLQLKISF